MKKHLLTLALATMALGSYAQTRGIESEATTLERTQMATFRLDGTSVTVEMRDKKSQIARLVVLSEKGDTLDAATFRPNSPLRQLPMLPSATGKITISVTTADGKTTSQEFLRP